jgi:membrane protein required for colicin V production
VLNVSLDGYDMVMLGILAAAAVIGYFKGIVWQIAWIAGIALSSFVAIRFAGPLTPFFGDQAPWNRFIAMLALYAGTSIVVWLVFRIISKAINAVHLSAFDHQLGLLFGAAKGALFCIVITFFAVTLAPQYRDQIIHSKSGRIVAQLIVQADAYLPKEVHDTVEPYLKKFEEQVQAAGVTFEKPIAGGGSGMSPLAAMWEGVSSASAWVGTEQGGQGVQNTVGTLPEGSRWYVPKEQNPPPSSPASFRPTNANPLPQFGR